MVQEWWTDEIVGEEFHVFSGYIAIGFSPVRAGLSEYVNEGSVDKGFFDPHLETDYTGSE
jgi:hypothetical protein